MTEQEAIKMWDDRIVPLAGDWEVQHNEADEMLLIALRSLGWNELANRWEKAAVNWWWP